ncbi:putative lipid II flippase MurJ [Candidatus Methylobacter favarea]|uniref:Probable lipid II flippase MurJ n=1 Tax=Candidatus Methylobacter favarea TaxID=2707345 RepID=A0A8S0Y6J4_9GAMM|nr:murein biosynthesis integral membrane protein MurJ [Candidatus Methylobacter favarea]CAA9891517.1 putative lipid II flippase MurJ [Candidatus Methylobacter favarea]
MSRQLLKSTGVVGSMTMLSRILGFVRDMLIAQIFGVNTGTDAFFVAFKIPNFLRRLFAEGAFAHAFVPVLLEYKMHGDKPALKQFIDKTAGALALILILITVIGIIAAPVLVAILAPGFIGQEMQYELAVKMLRITFPYLFFISLVAFAGGILNAYGKFAIPALTPAFLNICMIAAAIWLSPLMAEPVMALAWGVIAAGMVQMLFQLPALMRLRLAPRLRWGFKDKGVKRILGLMLPAIFSVSVTQINLLVDTLMASFLKAGSVSWLYYSDRLVEFPLGIFGLALATVILPRLAKAHAAEDAVAFSNSLDWGLRLVLLLGAPATIGLLMLAEPMLSTLFQYNEFSVADVHLAGQSLKAYAIGLIGFILIKVLAPAFTSRQDMKTPVRYGFYAMLASIGLNAVLIFPLAHAGLALATSLGGFFNAALLLRKLLKEKAFQPASGWGWFLARVAIASGAMAGGLGYFVDANWWDQWNSADRVINLIKWIIAGSAIYGAGLIITGLRLRHLADIHGKIINF